MPWPEHLEHERHRWCRACDVKWFGGPVCWCCGSDPARTGEAIEQA